MDFMPDNATETRGSCIQFESLAAAISHSGDANDLFLPDLIRGSKPGIDTHPEIIAALANQPVQHQSSVMSEEQDAAGPQVVWLQRAYFNGLAGPDKRLHAGAEGRELDGLPLLEKFLDQLPCVRLAT